MLINTINVEVFFLPSVNPAEYYSSLTLLCLFSTVSFTTGALMFSVTPLVIEQGPGWECSVSPDWGQRKNYIPIWMASWYKPMSIQFNKPKVSILQYHPYLLRKEYQKCYYITVLPLLVPSFQPPFPLPELLELRSSELLTSLLHLSFYFLFVGLFCLYFTYIPSVLSESLFSFSSIALHHIHRLLAGVDE